MRLRRTVLVIGITGILLGHLALVFIACRVVLPSIDHPLRFYSNQTRDDLKNLFITALSQAQESIYLSVYGISDPQIITTLNQSLCAKIRVEYDPSASLPLKQWLDPRIEVQSIKARGLMHRKIGVIDHSLVLLGSANFTPTSLQYHANLVIGLHHPPLATYLERPFGTRFSFRISDLSGTLFLLPDPQEQSLETLMNAIAHATKSIRVAMFTLTHDVICNALIAAKHRGVQVEVAVDYYTARGASKIALKQLLQGDIAIYLGQGQELLHHKWALIDNETLFMGSANWTKAAFSKNQDFLLHLRPLDKEQQAFFHRLWNVILAEATPLELSAL